MKNLYLLDTDKPSRLFYLGSNLHLEQGQLIVPKNYQHIYITNDEEIKEGDYFIESLGLPDSYLVHKLSNEWKDKESFYRRCVKVILTTDADLIADGVQSISDDFLKWLVNNQSCEEVYVGSEILYEHKDTYRPYPSGCKNLSKTKTNYYFSTFPTEEAKQETLEDYYIGKTLKVKKKIPSRYYESILQESETIKIDKFIDGNVEGCRVAIGYKNGFEYLLFNTAYVDSYLQSTFELIDESIIPKQETFERTKSTLRKHLFDNKAKLARDLEQMREWSNANKQETLVEVAEEFYSEQSKAYEDEIEPMFDTSRYLVAGFIEGAKWQQERMYSEEEVVQLLIKFNQEIQEVEDVRGWFEEFKKN